MSTKEKDAEATPAQAGAELPAVDLAAENSVMREALSKISRVNACDYEYVRWAREALSSLARRGGSDDRARNEAFNLADTVIEHMQCGREQEARAAIMEAFSARRGGS